MSAYRCTYRQLIDRAIWAAGSVLVAGSIIAVWALGPYM